MFFGDLPKKSCQTLFPNYFTKQFYFGPARKSKLMILYHTHTSFIPLRSEFFMNIRGSVVFTHFFLLIATLDYTFSFPLPPSRTTFIHLCCNYNFLSVSLFYQIKIITAKKKYLMNNKEKNCAKSIKGMKKMNKNNLVDHN